MRNSILNLIIKIIIKKKLLKMEGFNATKVKMGDFEVMQTLGTGEDFLLLRLLITHRFLR